MGVRVAVGGGTVGVDVGVAVAGGVVGAGVAVGGGVAVAGGGVGIWVGVGVVWAQPASAMERISRSPIANPPNRIDVFPLR